MSGPRKQNQEQPQEDKPETTKKSGSSVILEDIRGDLLTLYRYYRYNGSIIWSFTTKWMYEDCEKGCNLE